MTTDDTPHYDGKPIPQPARSLTPTQQLALLDWHPLFTGRCPECEQTIVCGDDMPEVWRCGHCGWQTQAGAKSLGGLPKSSEPR